MTMAWTLSNKCTKFDNRKRQPSRLRRLNTLTPLSQSRTESTSPLKFGRCWQIWRRALALSRYENFQFVLVTKFEVVLICFLFPFPLSSVYKSGV